MEIFAQFMHEQPLFDAYIVKHRMETLQITDLMPAKDFQRTNIYNEFYKKVGVKNQLVTPMKITDDLLITCSINTLRQDFSDRDKLILTLAAPHFASAIRNAFAYDRLLSALETENCGVVALNADNNSVYISQYAHRLLEKYFADEKLEANLLPESLSAWLKQAAASDKSAAFKSPSAPLKIEGQNGELLIRFVCHSLTGEKTLLLEEKRYFDPQTLNCVGLTERETEVLFWIMQGKTDDVIKTLLKIRLRTVHKHVENIYAKLGVETRTAAMMKALEFV